MNQSYKKQEQYIRKNKAKKRKKQRELEGKNNSQKVKDFELDSLSFFMHPLMLL